jgi:hypothetical protein
VYLLSLFNLQLRSMKVKTTKKQVLAEFAELWRDMLKSNPSLRGDTTIKREAFNNYVDGLNKDGRVTDAQAFNWSNPF